MLNAVIKHGKSSLAAKLIATILLVGVADFLFLHQPLGWTAGLYALILLLTTAFFHATAMRSMMGLGAFTLSLGACYSLIDAPNTLAALLFITGIFTILGLRIWQVAGNPIEHLWRIAVFSFLFWSSAFRDYAHVQRFKKARIRSNLFVHFARGWIIPIVFFAVFLALFTRANPIIEKWWGLIDFASLLSLFSIWRLLFWTIVAAIVWGILRPLRFPAPTPDDAFSGQAAMLPKVLLSEAAVLRSLVLFNALFLLQNALDVMYLWGGEALPAGMTYAEYAHRGVYPLIATALLAALFVLLTLRPEGGSRRARMVKGLVYIWLAQNVVLVVSSIWRTKIYIDEYSLTYLRYAAVLWMALVAAGLALIILRVILRRDNIWLINANLAAVFLVLYAHCFFDAGRFIAVYNVSHSKELTGSGIELDIGYLRDIGTASLPALQSLRQTGKLDAKRLWHVEHAERMLRQDVARSLGNWRAWTLRNYRLSQQLDAGPAPEAASFPFSRDGFFYRGAATAQ